MAKAMYRGALLAESDVFEVVERNVYFPRSSLDMRFFRESPTKTTCGWKGEASYFHVVVDGATNEDAAWTYPSPKDAARAIAGHVAFWRGVEVTK